MYDSASHFCGFGGVGQLPWVLWAWRHWPDTDSELWGLGVGLGAVVSPPKEELPYRFSLSPSACTHFLYPKWVLGVGWMRDRWTHRWTERWTTRLISWPQELRLAHLGQLLGCIFVLSSPQCAQPIWSGIQQQGWGQWTSHSREKRLSFSLESCPHPCPALERKSGWDRKPVPQDSALLETMQLRLGLEPTDF